MRAIGRFEHANRVNTRRSHADDNVVRRLCFRCDTHADAIFAWHKDAATEPRRYRGQLPDFTRVKVLRKSEQSSRRPLAEGRGTLDGIIAYDPRDKSIIGECWLISAGWQHRGLDKPTLSLFAFWWRRPQFALLYEGSSRTTAGTHGGRRRCLTRPSADDDAGNASAVISAALGSFKKTADRRFGSQTFLPVFWFKFCDNSIRKGLI